VLARWFGAETDWWVVALASWLLVAVLGVLRVDVNGRVLAVLLIAEIAVIVVFSVADLFHPAGGTVTFDTLSPANLAAPGIGAILALAMLGFVGFESAVVFCEESRDPVRTVPAATFTSIALIAVLYAGGSWAMTVAVGPDRVAAVAREQGPETIFGLAADHLGPLAADAGRTLFLTSLVAAMIAFHNTTARYFYALGREGVLPRPMGAAGRRTGSPVAGSLLQSLVGLVVIVVFAVAGFDPLVQLFFWGGTGGGLGVLLLTATTAVAVVAFFARGAYAARGPRPAWASRGGGREAHAACGRRGLLAPVASAVALWTVAALALANLPTLLGVAPDAPLRWLVPGAYLAAAVAGFGWALVLRARRPHVYRRIGLGAKATTMMPVQR
jgi:amino acid transporter